MIDLFCVASGGSLTKADCALVANSGAKILTVNNTWQMFEKSDYIYAGDLKWWMAYHDKIIIPAERWTSSKKAARDYHLNLHTANGPFNSGMRAIQWAIQNGFKSIALLGYDCSLKNGSHWHGNHNFKTASALTQQKINKWKMQFLKVEKQAKSAGVKIYNCSRYTELVCFPRAVLEDVLGLTAAPPSV